MIDAAATSRHPEYLVQIEIIAQNVSPVPTDGLTVSRSNMRQVNNSAYKFLGLTFMRSHS